MGTFISQDETPTLYADKQPAPGQSLRPGWSLDNVPTAQNLNDLKGALLDVRTSLRTKDYAYTWDTLTAPFVLGHRGGSLAAPENTLASLDYAAGLGVVLEFDLTNTLDGVPVLSHDDTLTRATASAVNNDIRRLTADQVTRVDVSKIFFPTTFGPQYVPTFESVLRRYQGKRVLMLPEVKEDDAAVGARVAQLISKYDMSEQVAVQSFYAAPLQAVKAVDPRIRTVFLDTGLTSLAAGQSIGAWAMFILHSALTAQYVADAHAAGLKVLAWTPNQLSTIEAVLAKGVDGVCSDDPALALLANRYTPRGTTIVDPPLVSVGAHWRVKTAGSFAPAVVSGYGTFAVSGTVPTNDFYALYVPTLRPSATLATTQTLFATIKAVALPTSGDLTRHMGLRFCWATDTDTNVAVGPVNADMKGYTFAYRANGTVEITRLNGAGGQTVIATTAWATYAAGAIIPLRVDLTATAITVTRTDNSQTITVNDSTYPRTGHVSVYGSGVVPGVGQTTLTY